MSDGEQRVVGIMYLAVGYAQAYRDEHTAPEAERPALSETCQQAYDALKDAVKALVPESTDARQ